MNGNLHLDTTLVHVRPLRHFESLFEALGGLGRRGPLTLLPGLPDSYSRYRALFLEEIEKLIRESPGHLCGYLSGESMPPSRSRRSVLAGALLTAISPLMAQSGRVRIRVTNGAGAVIVGAEGSLLGKDEGPILTERSNEVGEIIFVGLPMGDSRIKISCTDFKTLPLVVTVRNADELKIDAKLEATMTVEVMGVFHKKRKRWWLF